MAMLRHSCASTMSVKNRPSKDTVGDDMLSPSFKYLFVYFYLHMSSPNYSVSLLFIMLDASSDFLLS